MNTRQSKVKPVILEVAILNALARVMQQNGVPNASKLAQECLTDLVGNRTVEPPEGVPTSFDYKRTTLHWPVGLDARVPTEAECNDINDVLRTLPGYSRDSLLDHTTDSVRNLRDAYVTLFNRRKREQREAVEHANKIRDERAQAALTEIATLQEVAPAPIKPARKVKATRPMVHDDATMDRKRADVASMRTITEALGIPEVIIQEQADKIMSKPERKKRERKLLTGNAVIVATGEVIPNVPVIEHVVPQDTTVSTMSLLDQLEAELASM